MLAAPVVVASILRACTLLLHIYPHIHAKRIMLRKFLQLSKPSNCSPRKVAICNDSALVFLGANGECRKWALDWVERTLSNAEPCKELVHELDSHDRVTEWIKVPSHAGFQEADSLAENRRPRSSPLLRQSVAPATRSIKQSLAQQR